MFDQIQRDNWTGLDHEESWRATDQIMRDDLIPRKFEEVLGVPNHYFDDSRIWATIERVRHDFEHEMWQMDEGRRDHFRRLGEERNYY